MLRIKRIWNTTQRSRFKAKHFQFASMLIKSPSPSLQGRHPIVSRVAKPPFGRAGSSRTPWNVIRNRDINFVLTPVTVRNRDCTDVTPTANYASYAKMLWSPLAENLQRIEKGRSFVLLCLGKERGGERSTRGVQRSVCCEIGYRPRGLLCKCYRAALSSWKSLVATGLGYRLRPLCRCDQMISGWERRGGDD